MLKNKRGRKILPLLFPAYEKGVIFIFKYNDVTVLLSAIKYREAIREVVEYHEYHQISNILFLRNDCIYGVNYIDSEKVKERIMRILVSADNKLIYHKKEIISKFIKTERKLKTSDFNYIENMIIKFNEILIPYEKVK